MNVPLLEAGARQLDRVERDTRLDGVIAVLRRAVQRVVPPGPVADALHGTWLGHPLHPALTDVPVGAWLGAAVLDAVPGQETAATVLVGVGVAAAVPTALSGATDWSETDPEQQRLGLWHGLANATATAVYAASLVARLRGRHGAGRALAGLGLAAAGVGAYLGGHLSYRAGAGFNQPSRPGGACRTAGSRSTTWPGYPRASWYDGTSATFPCWSTGGRARCTC